MEQIIALIQGPASATVIMAAIIFSSYKFVLDHVVPRVDLALKESNDRYKAMIQEHKSDRDAWLGSICWITERLDKMTDTTADMNKCMEELHQSVTEIKHQMHQDSQNV